MNKKIKDTFVIRIDNVNELFETLTNIKENSDIEWVGNEEIEPEKDVEIFDDYGSGTCLILNRKGRLWYGSITSILNDNDLKNNIGNFNDMWDNGISNEGVSVWSKYKKFDGDSFKKYNI